MDTWLSSIIDTLATMDENSYFHASFHILLVCFTVPLLRLMSILILCYYWILGSNFNIHQPLDTASSRMQTSKFGKSKGLWKSLSESSLSEAFDALGISLLLTTNPSIQVLDHAFCNRGLY